MAHFCKTAADVHRLLRAVALHVSGDAQAATSAQGIASKVLPPSMYRRYMIAELLPPCVVAVEAREDPSDVVLFAEEEAALGRAVEKRRREFTTARDCAHRALTGLGHPPQPILSGDRGQPCWPAGVVGSITHCHSYRACAVARASDLLTVGIDAEPHEPLPEGVLGAIATAQELAHLRELSRIAPDVHWDRLLFSAKESVYKAWFPLAKRPLGFHDALLTLDSRRGAFSAQLLVPGPVLGGAQLSAFAGRWLARDGLLLTGIALAPS